MSGNKFSDHLLKLFPHIKVIFMSGFADSAAVQNNEINNDQTISIISKPLVQQILLLKEKC